MRVSQLAQHLNTSADTVRYYSKIGLLTPVKGQSNGYKNYDRQQQHRLRFILTARQLGFTVNDIRAILAEAGQHSSACPLVRRLIEQRLAEVEQQFQQTLQLRSKMLQALAQWRDLPDKQPNGHEICHLIESFWQHPDDQVTTNTGQP